MGERVMTLKAFGTVGILRSVVVATFACGFLIPAQAQEPRARSVSDWVITKAQANKTECSCRMGGQSLPVGSEICMQNSMFRCQMDQNVTTWRPLSSPCPQS
jgi:hypothetical protein